MRRPARGAASLGRRGPGGQRPRPRVRSYMREGGGQHTPLHAAGSRPGRQRWRRTKNDAQHGRQQRPCMRCCARAAGSPGACALRHCIGLSASEGAARQSGPQAGRRCGAHVIQILSVETSATHGLRTFAASRGNLASSQAGSDTRKKSSLRLCSLNSRLRSRSCSASASFCTSCSMNSALATSAYQVACAPRRARLRPAATACRLSGLQAVKLRLAQHYVTTLPATSPHLLHTKTTATYNMPTMADLLACHWHLRYVLRRRGRLHHGAPPALRRAGAAASPGPRPQERPDGCCRRWQAVRWLRV